MFCGRLPRTSEEFFYLGVTVTIERSWSGSVATDIDGLQLGLKLGLVVGAPGVEGLFRKDSAEPTLKEFSTMIFQPPKSYLGWLEKKGASLN